MTDFFKSVIKGIDEVSVLGDGNASAEFTGTIDTGSYILNALLSGSIYGGVANNKVVAFAGEQATGKTFFALGLVQQFLTDHDDGAVFYFDTEAAVTKDMMESRGIDSDRVFIVEPVTVQEFRHKAIQILDNYIAQGNDKPPMMFVLDSLGQLSTTKEIEDTSSGSETKDMTRAGIIKAAFRVLNLKLAKAKVPFIVTNHVYAQMSLYGGNEMAGGCLVAGTNILTQNGLKPINEITLGEKVFTKEGIFKEVLDTHHFSNKDLLEIEFEDGYKVTCTPEHKFFINDMWVEAKDIKENDEVQRI